MLSDLKRLLKLPLSKEDIAFRLVPLFTAEVIRKYLRIECVGTEYLPKDGRFMVVANHSGYAGFDAVMITNEVRRAIGRRPKIMAHRLWFFGRPVAVAAEKMGLVPASKESAIDTLKNDDILVFFPEGEAGNFKPTNRRYRLQEFKRGFVRIALASQCPIVPCVVIGAEETHINLSQLHFTKHLIGTVLPIPLNVLPLPVKWKIQFLPPIYLTDCAPEDAANSEKVHSIATRIRRLMQRAIVNALRKRGQDLTGARRLNVEVDEFDVP